MPTYISLWGYLGGIIYSSSSSNVIIVTGPSPRSWPKMWSSPQYPQGGWARNISSGRMSSRTIHCSLYYHGACHHNILREDELATYPQGGWALEQFFVLFTTMVVVTTISSGRMSSLHILREDELEDHSWFSLLLGYLATISSWRMSSLNILREDELENYSWFSLLPWYLAIISSGRMISLHAHMDDELKNHFLVFFTTMLVGIMCTY